MASRGRWLRSAVSAAVLVSLAALAAFAAKEYRPPKVSPAGTYAARDAHPKEKVTIAADPYDTKEKLEIFRLKYLEHGILPVNLIVTNEGETPIALNGITIQLTSSDRRSKLSPLQPDDIFRRVTNLKTRDEVTRRRIGPPISLGKKASGLKQEDRDEVTQSRFQAAAVEPNSTQAGFAFFDIGGLEYPLPGATLYITGVRDSNGNDLMFFEIPLENVMTH